MPEHKLLVVDDDPGIINIITASLKGEGRVFITASDGVAAVGKIMSEAPDIILLDVMMPKMNGYQVCRLIKNDRNTWDIPVVMLTAQDSDSDRFYGESVGADEYITKPFHPGELRSVVEKLLAKSPPKSKSCPIEPPSRTTEAGLLSKVNSLLDRKLQEMTFLQEMTKTMVSTFDEDRILGLVLDGIDTYLGYVRAVVFMAEEGGQMAETRSKGYPRHQTKFSFEVTDTQALHEIMHQKKPFVMDGAWEDGSFVNGAASGPGQRHALIPIVAREEVRGVLLIDRDGGGSPFSAERTGVLNTMAGQLGLALENARLYRTTLMMSITDGLTGLYNVRYFYDRLETEITRADRYARPLSLFMLDIDHFKHFNDTFGHLIGDVALRRLAEILRETTRETDTAARYGGEEFCIILPETDQDHAMRLAERIRHTVEQTPVDVGDKTENQSLTVSIGCATLQESVNTPEAFVRCADRALYKAKEEGRNRVRLCTPELR